MNGHNDVSAGAIVVNDSQLYEELKWIQINYGLICAPFDCYLVNRGLKTLALRMDKHCENSLTVARYLEKHPKISKVIHPGLPSHPQYVLARTQSSGHCGMILIQLNGSLDEAKKFVLALRVFRSSDSLGTYASFASLP